jgi:hypothetical protein
VSKAAPRSSVIVAVLLTPLQFSSRISTSTVSTLLGAQPPDRRGRESPPRTRSAAGAGPAPRPTPPARDERLAIASCVRDKTVVRATDREGQRWRFDAHTEAEADSIARAIAARGDIIVKFWRREAA